jgi:hypothetical protein
MKRQFLNLFRIIRLGYCSLIFVFLVCFFTAAQARGSAELNHQYRLESIAFFKALDNVDGLFAEYVASAYQSYFSHQSRFVLNDLNKVDQILTHSKLPYEKAIYDKEILNQIAHTTHTDSFIRTKIIKEGPKYFFTLEWLHSSQMVLLGSIQFTLDEPNDGSPLGSDFVSEALTQNLSKLIAQVPFFGQVTGRDDTSVTISLGTLPRVTVGDILVVGSLEEVKKHPLLKKIVDWRIHPVGKILVEQIEDGMAFAKVLEEEQTHPISRLQKVYQVQARSPSPSPHSSAGSPPGESETHSDPSLFQPKFGWASAGVFAGNYSRGYSSTADSVNNSGGGILFGAQVQGELWLTRVWFAQLDFASSTVSYSQHSVLTGADSAATQNGGVGASITAFKLSAGYNYFINNDLMGPKVSAKVGYRTTSFSLPADATEATGPSSYKSFFIGLAGEIPVQDGWGAVASFDFKLLTSTQESTIGTSDSQLYFGAYRKLTSRMTVRAGVDIHFLGEDFSADKSLTQKTITIGPSLLYYF